jgi:hypothetical protein
MDRGWHLRATAADGRLSYDPLSSGTKKIDFHAKIHYVFSKYMPNRRNAFASLKTIRYKTGKNSPL